MYSTNVALEEAGEFRGQVHGSTKLARSPPPQRSHATTAVSLICLPTCPQARHRFAVTDQFRGHPLRNTSRQIIHSESRSFHRNLWYLTLMACERRTVAARTRRLHHLHRQKLISQRHRTDRFARAGDSYDWSGEHVSKGYATPFSPSSSEARRRVCPTHRNRPLLGCMLTYQGHDRHRSETTTGHPSLYLSVGDSRCRVSMSSNSP